SSRSIAPGWTNVSGFSNNQYSLAVRAAARLLALAKPTFSLDWISFTCGYVLATASALPSVDALSTTTTSSSVMVRLAKIDSRHSSRCWRVFQLTTMIESIMMIGSDCLKEGMETKLTG